MVSKCDILCGVEKFLFTLIYLCYSNWEKGVTLVVSEPVCQSVGLSDWFVELLFVLLCNSWILLRWFC